MEAALPLRHYDSSLNYHTLFFIFRAEKGDTYSPWTIIPCFLFSVLKKAALPLRHYIPSTIIFCFLFSVLRKAVYSTFKALHSVPELSYLVFYFQCWERRYTVPLRHYIPSLNYHILFSIFSAEKGGSTFKTLHSVHNLSYLVFYFQCWERWLYL